MMRGWNLFRGASREVQENAARRQTEEEEEERKKCEKFFLKAMDTDGKFEQAMAELDELGDADVTRLLGWAVFKDKDPGVIRKIGEKCSNISEWSLRKMPAIHLAIETGNVRGLEELISMGADVNSDSGNSDVTRALHRAVRKASIPCVETLLEQAEIEIDAPNSEGYTALHLCSHFAQNLERQIPDEVFAEIAAALIKRGASKFKESTTEPRITPLSYALRVGSFRILEKMVQVGERPPAPVTEAFMKEVRERGADSKELLDFFVESGWDESASKKAAALKGIQDALRASPNREPHQRSAGGRAQPPSLPLHDAAKSGDVAALAKHLSSGLDVNAVDKHGATALHAAAMHGHDGVVETLLRADGIEIDKPDASKLTALYRAAVANQVGAVEALLEAGASPHAKDQKGASVLHKVVTRKAGPVLEALLDHGASPGTGGEKGWTPLHTACQAGKSGTVEALLGAGALPGHCWNESLQSPLVIACRHGNLNAVQQLLPVLSKRQLNMRSGIKADAETVLGAAIRCATLTMDSVAIVEALLEAGADPHVRTGPQDVPPLALVVIVSPENGAVNNVATHPEIGPLLVQALVAAGADVNQDATDSRGFTPLQLACAEGACGEVVQALLAAGAEMLAAPCISFLGPLQLAAYGGGNLGAIRVLLDHPQSGGLNAQAGPDRDTPLSAAIHGGKVDVVRFLLEEGADMDLLPCAEEGKKRSLIELAAALGHVDIMRLLIQAKIFKDRAEQQAEDANAKRAEEAALR
eukprot:g4781.t1